MTFSYLNSNTWSSLGFSSKCYLYTTENKLTEKKDSFPGYASKIEGERVSPFADNNNLLLQGYAEVLVAGGRISSFSETEEHDLFSSRLGLDITLLHKISGQSALGILGGYHYEYNEQKFFNETLVDTNNDGLPDNYLLYKNDQSFHNNIFKFGLNLTIKDLELKPYYKKNSLDNALSGFGVEVKKNNLFSSFISLSGGVEFIKNKNSWFSRITFGESNLTGYLEIGREYPAIVDNNYLDKLGIGISFRWPERRNSYY